MSLHCEFHFLDFAIAHFISINISKIFPHPILDQKAVDVFILSRGDDTYAVLVRQFLERVYDPRKWPNLLEVLSEFLKPILSSDVIAVRMIAWQFFRREIVNIAAECLAVAL